MADQVISSLTTLSRWSLHFMRLAREVSTLSKDPSTQVGAILVNNRRVVGTGFNGFPPGISDDNRLYNRQEKYELIVHAEMNALLDAGRESLGSTLYLYGFSGAPCRNCTKHLITGRIHNIVVCGPEIPERWSEHLEASLGTLDEAGVPVVKIPFEVLG